MFGRNTIQNFKSTLKVASIVIASIVCGIAGISATAAAPDYAIGSRWFKSADADRDQKVTPGEAGGLAIKRFSRLDRDGDGVATVEEIDRLLGESVARRRERLLRRLDTDRDRVITRAEIETRTTQMFTDIDADRDGGITFEEMRAFRAEQRAKRKRRPTASSNSTMPKSN